MDQRLRFAAFIAAAVLLGWFFRFDVTPIRNGSGQGSAMVLNRWTGESYFTYGFVKGDIVEKKSSGQSKWWESDPLVKDKP